MKGITKIKNIIFDLGGVLIDIDVNKTIDEMRKILTSSAQLNSANMLQHKVFNQYETGQLTSNEFIQELQNLATIEVEKSQIVDAWNAMLLQVPKKRIKLLENLAEKKRLFILSNTNQLHVNKFNTMIPGYSSFENLVEKVYFSHEIGHRKPHKEAFSVVINNSNISPAETLFIDDTPENINTALEMNFQTLLVKKDEEITQLLNL